MGRKFRKYSKLLFKIVLLIQLYCHHDSEVDAVPIRQENLKTYDNRHHNRTYFQKESEKDIQRTKRSAGMQYFFQEEENGTVTDKRFYGPAASCVEISKLGYTLNGYYLVKGKNQTKNDQVEVIDCQFKHPNGSREITEERIGFIDIEITKSVNRKSRESFEKIDLEEVQNVDDDRPKRPVRLLPWTRIIGKPKNNVEMESETRFYGPASSCEELGKLGYTLNGLYLVDCKDKSMKGKVEVIECRFKQPQGSKKANEERIGFVNIEAKTTKAVQRRHVNASKETKSKGKREGNRIKRPIRLLPPQILNGMEKNNIEENKVVMERFYGPPKSCIELGKLGYTLNGYYLVNGTASSHHIEISLCKFQQPLATTESFKDENFVLDLKSSKVLEYSIIKSTTIVPPSHDDDKNFLVMNKHNKCMSTRRLNQYEVGVVQSNCNPKEKEQLWKWVGDNLRNEFGFVSKAQKGINYFQVHLYSNKMESQWVDQKWKATDEGKIVSNSGLCLSVENDAELHDVVLSMDSCEKNKKGQFWGRIPQPN